MMLQSLNMFFKLFWAAAFWYGGNYPFNCTTAVAHLEFLFYYLGAFVDSPSAAYWCAARGAGLRSSKMYCHHASKRLHGSALLIAWSLQLHLLTRPTMSASKCRGMKQAQHAFVHWYWYLLRLTQYKIRAVTFFLPGLVALQTRVKYMGDRMKQ